MKNKLILGVFLIVILIANISFASYSTVTMEVVEEPVCTIKIGNNSKFEKKLISKDLTNKEVTIQLQVTNEEISDKTTGEIILVLDNSKSMTTEIENGKTRKDLIFDSAKSLISSLLKDNNDLKIGIVSFSTVEEATNEGTIADATLVSQLSNDANALNTAISNIEANGPRTDLHAGLTLASQQFSQGNTSKYMIVLTDGVPNVAIDFDTYYSDDVITKTKNQLKSLTDQNVHLITMLTGINEEVNATGTNKTHGDIVKEVFGTKENPTAGDFYYVKDDAIEQTIKNDIYNSLKPIEKTLKDITVVDYFPEEIIKNFDFSYVSEANIGEISAKVDETNNSITWTIPELTSGQIATVQYKLKLKENFDSSIVDKLLNTNEQQTISYTDFDGNKQSEKSDITPKLKLSEPPAVLPQTGIIALVGTGILASSLVIFSTIKLINIHNKMN